MHPKVVQAYSRAGFDASDYASTNDKVVAEFKRKTQGSTIERRIDQVYRVKRGNRDYIVYNVTEIGSDLAGNEHTCARTEGFYDKPEFSRVYDNRSGEIVATNISKTIRVYEIPFSRRNLQKILDSGTAQESEPVFTLDAGSSKHGGFTAHDFMHRAWDDLYEKATTGKLPNDLKKLPDDDEVDRVMKEARRKEEAEMKKPISQGRRAAQNNLIETEQINLSGEEQGEEGDEDDENLPPEVAKAYGAEGAQEEGSAGEEEEEPAKTAGNDRDLAERSANTKRASRSKGRRR